MAREKEKAEKVAGQEHQKLGRNTVKAPQLSQKGKGEGLKAPTQNSMRQKRVVDAQCDAEAEEAPCSAMSLLPKKSRLHILCFTKSSLRSKRKSCLKNVVTILRNATESHTAHTVCTVCAVCMVCAVCTVCTIYAVCTVYAVCMAPYCYGPNTLYPHVCNLQTCCQATRNMS
jgi:hypothetical protein